MSTSKNQAARTPATNEEIAVAIADSFGLHRLTRPIAIKGIAETLNNRDAKHAAELLSLRKRVAEAYCTLHDELTTDARQQTLDALAAIHSDLHDKTTQEARSE